MEHSENRVENMTRSGVFLMNFFVFSSRIINEFENHSYKLQSERNSMSPESMILLYNQVT